MLTTTSLKRKKNLNLKSRTSRKINKIFLFNYNESYCFFVGSI